MSVILRWLRLSISFFLFIIFAFGAFNYQTSIYLIYQAKGQLSILLNTQDLQTFNKTSTLSLREKENIELVEKIKKYSIDSLDYLPTNNFTRIYNQNNTTTLWVITACKPYSFDPYKWKFPIVGNVTYKGFFKKELANKERMHLVANGYDVDIRGVSAWSTLGWFSDPLMSSMLIRSKGSLCNLLFHELFHATYYAPSSVDFNENIASFLAHKATIQFLQNDTKELNRYQQTQNDNFIFSNYMLRKKKQLEIYYKQIENKSNKWILKLKALQQIADSIEGLPLHNKIKFIARKKDIINFKNAYFIDFQQYESMQDKLDSLFNKIYRGNLKKLVQDLKLNKINY